METPAPACIGIILDGNRRWAKERGLPKLEGHREGLENVKRVTRAARDRGVKHLAIFAFSTENWGREEVEVSHLLGLLDEALQKEFADLGKEGVRIRFVGERGRFSEKTQQAMFAAEESTKENTAITLWCCLSYGGRAEIVAAAKKAGEKGEITEASINENLWTNGMPDPDIIIRTSGEKRLSGFLTWQGVYSELFFLDVKWPDFSEEDLDEVLTEYAARERRRGT